MANNLLVVPHNLTVVKPECVDLPRHNKKIRLKYDISVALASKEIISPECMPLDVYPACTLTPSCEWIPCVDPYAEAGDSYHLHDTLLNTQPGSSHNLDMEQYQKLEPADRIIGSRVLKEYMLRKVELSNCNLELELHRRILLDKFYTPTMLVFPNHEPGSASYNLPPNKPIGCLALEKVFKGIATLADYACEIRRGNHVSVIGAKEAIDAFQKTPAYNFTPVEFPSDLQVVQNYLAQQDQAYPFSIPYVPYPPYTPYAPYAPYAPYVPYVPYNQ